MSDIATGKLVIWMRLQAKRITPAGNRTSIMLSAAADRLEQQEQRITELERELAAAKEDITSIAKQSVEDFEKRAWTPPCRFCVKFEECDFIPTDGGCCFEWRGARKGEGK